MYPKMKTRHRGSCKQNRVWRESTSAAGRSDLLRWETVRRTVRVCKPDPCARHLSDNLSVDAVDQPPDLRRREWVGKQEKMLVLKFAPRTGIPVAQLDKVDRPVVLGDPAAGENFAYAGIDLHERAWPQHGKERVVFESNIPVHAMANVETLDQSDGYLSPGFHHTRKQIGVTHIERGFEAYRKPDRLLFIGNF
jgi:hypothetical protein